MAERPNLRHVAAVAGVSHMTVSRVLSGHPNIKESTRQKVLEAVSELDYRPNIAARSLVTQRTDRIGVMIESGAEFGPSSTLRAIERAAREKGYSVTSVALRDDQDMSPVDAIRLIRAAGGVPVIAHPATRGRDTNISARSFEQLVEAGLLGVEVRHRENTEAGAERLRELAARHDLITTGSSDYHGTGKPNRLGENSTEPEQLARIVEAATGWSPVAG